MFKELGKILKSGKGGLYVLLPLFHRVFGIMFSEMEEKGIKTEWYKEILGSLLAFSCMEVYDDPKKEFNEYLEMIDKEYHKFAEKFVYEA